MLVRYSPSQLSRAVTGMPVLTCLGGRLAEAMAFQGTTVLLNVHVSVEVAAFVQTLCRGGAHVVVVPSKVATLVKTARDSLLRMPEVELLMPDDDSQEGRTKVLRKALACLPQLMVDNGETVTLLHTRPDFRPFTSLRGATIHSRSSDDVVSRMQEEGTTLRFPVRSIARSALKREIETTYGTGQSTIRGILQHSGRVQLSGMRALVIGYGNAGAGIVRYLRGMNARVCVADASAVRRLKAAMDGIETTEDLRAVLPHQDLIITATGDRGVINATHFGLLKDGALLGNVGHNSDEIDISELEKTAERCLYPSRITTTYVMHQKQIVVIGNGHQLNHLAGGGNSSGMMDLSLALHVLALAELNQGSLAPGLYGICQEDEELVARMKLATIEGRRPENQWW